MACKSPSSVGKNWNIGEANRHMVSETKSELSFRFKLCHEAGPTKWFCTVAANHGLSHWTLHLWFDAALQLL
jgi:hypothetical protein